MSEAIKTFQTFDNNPKISLIILKGNLSYVLKKCMFMFNVHVYVYLIVKGKAKGKTVKNFETA